MGMPRRSRPSTTNRFKRNKHQNHHKEYPMMSNNKDRSVVVVVDVHPSLNIEWRNKFRKRKLALLQTSITLKTYKSVHLLLNAFIKRTKIKRKRRAVLEI